LKPRPYLLVTVIGLKLVIDWAGNAYFGPHTIDFHSVRSVAFWAVLDFDARLLRDRVHRRAETGKRGRASSTAEAMTTRGVRRVVRGGGCLRRAFGCNGPLQSDARGADTVVTRALEIDA
jgi:hypothetical protein